MFTAASQRVLSRNAALHLATQYRDMDPVAFDDALAECSKTQDALCDAVRTLVHRFRAVHGDFKEEERVLCEAARANRHVSTFVATGPLVDVCVAMRHNLDYEPVARQVVLACKSTDVAPVVSFLVDHHLAHDAAEWPSDMWNVLEYGVCVHPSLYTRDSVRKRILNEIALRPPMTVDSRQRMLFLANELRADDDPSFDVEMILQLLRDGVRDARGGLALLQRHVVPALYAPSLLDAIDTLESNHVELPTNLVYVLSTSLPVRCVREGREDLLRRLTLHTAETTTLLVSLWPRMLSQVTGLPLVVASTPVTSVECPITMEPCVDPVVASDGHTYERDAILTLLSRSDRPQSPLTRQPLNDIVVPNRALATVHPFFASKE